MSEERDPDRVSKLGGAGDPWNQEEAEAVDGRVVFSLVVVV